MFEIIYSIIVIILSVIALLTAHMMGIQIIKQDKNKLIKWFIALWLILGDLAIIFRIIIG